MVGSSVVAPAVDAVVRVYLAEALVLPPRTFARLPTRRGVIRAPGFLRASEQTLRVVELARKLGNYWTTAAQTDVVTSFEGPPTKPLIT
jgi:hypothetical protein